MDDKNFLFKDKEMCGYEAEWKDMPEFIQDKQEPHQKIIIRFSCDADVQEFAKLIGQSITPKTKSIWHPQLIRGINSGKGYTSD